MRAREQLDAIKAVAEMRRLQEGAAQIAAARAAEGSRVVQARRDELARQLYGDQQDWARVIADASLGLPVAALWADQVARSESAFRVTQAEARSAEQQRLALSQAWGEALTRSRSADDLAARISRRVKRTREEAALGDLADRATQRRMVR